MFAVVLACLMRVAVWHVAHATAIGHRPCREGTRVRYRSYRALPSLNRKLCTCPGVRAIFCHVPLWYWYWVLGGWDVVRCMHRASGASVFGPPCVFTCTCLLFTGIQARGYGYGYGYGREIRVCATAHTHTSEYLHLMTSSITYKHIRFHLYKNRHTRHIA